jgi:hypothetical protein
MGTLCLSYVGIGFSGNRLKSMSRIKFTWELGYLAGSKVRCAQPAKPLDLRHCPVITSKDSSLSGVEGSGRQFVSTRPNELKTVNLFFDNG